MLGNPNNSIAFAIIVLGALITFCITVIFYRTTEERCWDYVTRVAHLEEPTGEFMGQQVGGGDKTMSLYNQCVSTLSE